MVRRFTLAAVVLLASCGSMEKADRALAQGWVGKDSDAFFLRYGPPAQKHQARTGETVYVWTTDGLIRNRPVPPYCEVQIVADERGLIKTIFSKAETIGLWTVSACNEHFR